MLNFLRKVFLPGDGKQSPRQPLNTAIYNEIRSCFIDNIKTLSVGGRMLYPTSFNILLHPDDYSSVEQSLPFIVQELTNSFYVVIKDKNNSYRDFAPPSSNWFFQFSPCAELSFMPNNNTPGKPVENTTIERNRPFILSSLYSTQIGRKNTETEVNVKMSLKPKNSDTYSMVDINPSTLTGIDILGKGIFRIPISKNLEPDSKLPVSEGNVYALIKFRDRDGAKTFSMIDREIIISQKDGDGHMQTNFLYVNHPAVQKSHARIKYMPDDNKFALAAFGFVALNDAALPESPNNAPVWASLTNDTKILLGKPSEIQVQLTFFIPPR